ncbi:MAG: hydroxyacid dehydrogenase [Candidatus Eisenbacteria sp.]|nr:hydroxyacid dehydrogenase [Candidatus Eisenbacteria bacterium]
MFDVYFYEVFEEEAVWLKKLLPPEIRAGYTWKTVQESGDQDPPAAFISVRTQSRLPAAWKMKLGAILSRTTGFDHLRRYLDSDEGAPGVGGSADSVTTSLPGRSVSSPGSSAGPVPGSAAVPAAGYLPLYCSRAVAEQAMMLWMVLLRRLPLQLERFREFNRDGLTGRECAGKTLVVVGVGNIGSELVKIGCGLEMTVIGVDLAERHEFVHYEMIEEALPRADVVVCSMNLTPENTGYFDVTRLHRMPRGAVFVNIARGEMSPTVDLLAAVEEGHLGGVGLDVYNRESELAISLRTGKRSDDREVQAILALSRHPNVILTPHNAFNSDEAVERKARQSLEQVVAFRSRGGFIWPVP